MSMGAIIMLVLIAAVTWIGFKLRDQEQRIEELSDVLGTEKRPGKAKAPEVPGTSRSP
jgi:hypothetical protein